MNVTITPTRLHGTITPPPSKSQSHRLLLAAALADGESTLQNVALSEDIQATLSCAEQLGATWVEDGGALTVRGIGGGPAARRTGDLPRFNCGESGSTLRFLIPIALALCGGGVFTGRGRLMERPQGPYEELFREKGIAWEQENGVLTVRGRLEPGEYRLAGNVSSQFFTGLLYALSLLEGPSRIVPTTQLESVDYVFMTLEALRLAGVEAKWQKGVLTVEPSRFAPFTAAVEADWSQAAFWYAAAGIGNAVAVNGMNFNSTQGDKEILCWGEQIDGKPLTGGVTVPIWGEAGSLVGGRQTEHQAHGTSLDVSRCPDLVPPAAAWGAYMNGTLYLKKAGRLRMKESDRLAAVAGVLTALGSRVWEEPERLIIEGAEELPGGVEVDCCNDHRIAMMAAIVATRCKAPVTLRGAECVKKSYPGFWSDYEKLGGVIQKEA